MTIFESSFITCVSTTTVRVTNVLSSTKLRRLEYCYFIGDIQWACSFSRKLDRKDMSLSMNETYLA